MLSTATCLRGMVTAPHHLAAESGLAVLRDGGNAIEAMVAAAATIAVVYPHMNSIGGDAFWLVHCPGREPMGIDACGASGVEVTPQRYHRLGLDAVPPRGPLAANTVAGTVAGWHEALALSGELGGRLGLGRLLADAIAYAEHGVPVTASQSRLTTDKRAELEGVPGFSRAFLPGGGPPPAGRTQRQPRLAETLRVLAARGLDDFYRGELAARIAADLAQAGSPLTLEDLAACRARSVTPLSVRVSSGRLYNLPPPTQGLASLMILGIFDRIDRPDPESHGYVHALVEATKMAFEVRDREIRDPDRMRVDPRTFLTAEALQERAQRIDPARARPWPAASSPGDTVWLGSVDSSGRAVSFIQSLYWEFGSGVVLEESGILWQNRGSSFSLSPDASSALGPRRRPFHTLNPALAILDDGRVMAYGTMGGEGQPQTQAALYTRYAAYGNGLQEAVTAPRWLLGRTWGQESTTLKLESRFDPGVVEWLRRAGHRIETVAAYDEMMGHAGALVRHADGLIEGAADPRADGRAAGF